MNEWTQSRSAWLVAGAAVGAHRRTERSGVWPSVPLHATATHGLDKFAIATGLVDDTVEAIYFLDFLTGDLRAAVINPKTGKFNALYTRNIATDFGAGGRGSPLLDRDRIRRHAARPRELPVRQEHRLRGRGQHRTSRRLHDSLELGVPGGRQAAAGRVCAARRRPSSAPRLSATNSESASRRMQIEVNGERREVAEGTTIAGLLRELDVTQPHVAVEVNLEVVPRARHAETTLQAGDRLEVVTLVGGG